MSVEEVLTARITADVSEAVSGFRQVDVETKRLQASMRTLAMSFTGVFTAGMTLYNAYERIQEVQSDAKASQEEVNKAYMMAAFTVMPAVISGAYNVMRLYSSLKAVLASATLAQWLYNKALAVTHALSGPAGWAILGIAAAVTVGAVAWMSLNEEYQQYNKTIDETTEKTRELLSVEAELSRMSPLERLQREYVVVKRYYETFSERTTHEEAGSGGSVSVSIGNVQVSANELGSPFDRDRAAEDLAQKIGHKLALKVITR